MRKMKILTAISLVVLTLFMGACSFNVSLSGCTEKKEEPLPEVMPASTFSLTIESKEELLGFYAGVFEGVLYFDYYPEKFAVKINDTDFNVIPSSVSAGNGFYAFKFKKQDILFSIKKGEHLVRVCGYKNGEQILKPETSVLVANGRYVTTAVICDGGKSFTAMDRIS